MIRSQDLPDDLKARIGIAMCKSRAKPVRRKPAKVATVDPTFASALRDAGLPLPIAEHRFCERRWRFDYCWPDRNHMLALEVEGGIWTHGRHVRGSGYAKDMEKYNRAAMMGYYVLRVQPKDLCSATTIEMIRTALSFKIPVDSRS